ncbi:hypothetical protein Lalb_Chr12g0208171 [Lupinus albus]|uniref:Uncharacterized protein n=1 Tax=Lupinus albus TaxID=3870 RepID=A0A6A4PP49_LUPAL|nr:hypothetical protein Lalb_Chr12g0208171 [Lupinus albus]
MWHNLEKKPKDEEEATFAGRLNVRISMDGGHHVLDEATHYTSDLRPSSKHLCSSGIDILELGIMNDVGFSPINKENYTDAYCVAKYGPKWVRTRTIVVVFDNAHLHQEGENAEAAVDKRIGKIRIRLSAPAYKLLHSRWEKNSVGCEIFLSIFVECFANLMQDLFSQECTTYPH